MSIGQKIASNTVTTVSGRILSSLLGFVSIAIMSRYLGKEGFGDYNIALVFLYIILAVSDLGLYSILSREISKPGSDEKKIIGGVLGLRLVSVILFFVFAFIVLYFLPYSQNVKIGVLLASPGFLFLSSKQLLMGVFQKHLKTIWFMIGEVIERGFQLALIGLFVFLHLPFIYFLIAVSISIFSGFAIDLFFARKIVGFKLSFDYDFSKSMLKKSWPLAVSSVLTLVYFKMDTFLLSLMKPSADVGIYSVAYKVFEGLLFFPAAFSGLMLPLLSNSAISDREQFKIYFKKAFDFILIIVFPIMIGGMVLSQKIAFLIGGKEFVASSVPLKILMGALFFVFIGNLLGNAIIALDKQKKMVYIYALGMFISVTFNLIFIPKYSYMATSWATLVTEAAVNSAMFFIIIKELKYWPADGKFLRALLASLVMGAIIYLNLDWNIFVLMIMGGAIYFVLMFLLKGITREEIKLLLFKKAE